MLRSAATTAGAAAAVVGTQFASKGRPATAGTAPAARAASAAVLASVTATAAYLGCTKGDVVQEKEAPKAFQWLAAIQATANLIKEDIARIETILAKKTVSEDDKARAQQVIDKAQAKIAEHKKLRGAQPTEFSDHDEIRLAFQARFLRDTMYTIASEWARLERKYNPEPHWVDRFLALNWAISGKLI